MGLAVLTTLLLAIPITSFKGALLIFCFSKCFTVLVSFGMQNNLKFASETYWFLIFLKDTKIINDKNKCLKEFNFTVFIPITGIL